MPVRRPSFSALSCWLCLFLGMVVMLLQANAARAQLPGAAPTAARAVLDMDATKQPVLLKDWADGLLDETGQRSIDDVLASGNWERWNASKLSLRRGQTQWLKFSVPPAPDAERWYLEIPLSSLDRATLYVLDSSGKWTSQASGDLIAVNMWPVPARHPLLPIVVSAEYPVQHVLAIQSNVPVRTSLRFVSEGHWSAKEQRSSLVLGGFFGLCLILLAYALLSAAVLRDTNYTAFSVHVVCLLVWQAGATGIGAMLLWPGWPEWADMAPAVGALLGLPPLYYLITRVTGLGDRVPRWQLATWVAAVIVFLACAMLLLIGAQSRFRDVMVPAAGFLLTLPLLVACGHALWRADRVAPWVIAAVAPGIAMAWVNMAALQGVIGENWIAQHGMRLALVWQLPMLLVALALRAQERRAVRQRLADLGRVDGNTGLVSQEVLAYRTNLAIVRAKRLGNEAGLLRIDIEQVESLRKSLGKRTWAGLQLRYADRLLRLVRDIDTVASLEEGVYAILVDGPAKLHVSRDLAVRIVAASLQPFAKLALPSPPKVRVHFLSLPNPEGDAQAALDALARAYGNCDLRDKRAVFWVDSDQMSRPVEQWGGTANPLDASATLA